MPTPMPMLAGASRNCATAPRTASMRILLPSSFSAIDPDWSNMT
jgi:hypothetical protein